ncbi:MAG TPA: histidine kinase [Gemmatimonadaceae bacterium]|jgi:hypothetical protein|nr:histidine kinase [Gemmatimonadaceae bacterium]
MAKSPVAPLDDQPPRIPLAALFVLFTVAWMLRFAYFTLDDVTRSYSGTAVRHLLEEGTGSYSAMMLFPLIAAAERRFPLSSGRWRNWPWHLGAVVPYTALHTSLMAMSRWTLFPALGLGAYDYGRMSIRYFMEAPEDAISYATLLCLLTFLRVQQELRAREVRAAALERDTVAARLEALSLRLQPHFLFNALNTISSTVYDDPIAADEMIGRLGDLLRQALRTSDRQEVSVGEEMDTLRAYLAFVDARFGDRVRCALRVGADASAVAVPVFLLQPLVENAVRHGLSSEYEQTDIDVSIALNGGRLRVVVDNAVAEARAARATRVEPARIGTGLGTTRDRLRLLYGSDGQITSENANGRFRVSIEIPARPASPRETVADVEHAGAHR